MASISTLKKAIATLEGDGSSDSITNGEVVVVGGKTYTFQTTLTNVDGNVAIGASINAAIANLVAAVNLGAGAGTAYAAAMTINPHVAAALTEVDTDSDLITFTAKVPGLAGNLIALTTDSDCTLSGAVLEGGLGSIITALQEVITSAQINSEVLQALQSFIIAAPAGEIAE